MTSAQLFFFLYLVMMLIGFILELGFAEFHHRLSKKSHKESRFSFGRYVVFLLFPLLATFMAARLSKLPFITLFLAFAIFGTALEWIIGLAYDKVVGRKMWIYYRFSLGGYSSLLSVPIWGMAGVFFWLLVNAISK